MARSSAQSDFVFAAEEEVFDQPMPRSAEPVKLPRAVWRTNQASAFATRWVMAVMWLMLAALAILCAVGPHIPAGE